jgi:hypothetical protein
MEKRPLSLTIIGWFLIVTGLFTIYSVLRMGSNPIAMKIIEQMHVSLLFQQVMGALGVIVALACAYGIFKGLPWSRVLYVAWGIISLGISFFTSPVKSIVILSVLFLMVVAYFLFRPAADRWFAAKGLQLQRDRA